MLWVNPYYRVIMNNFWIILLVHQFYSVLNWSGQQLSELCWVENLIFFPLAVTVCFNVLVQDHGALNLVWFIPQTLGYGVGYGHRHIIYSYYMPMGMADLHQTLRSGLGKGDNPPLPISTSHFYCIIIPLHISAPWWMWWPEHPDNC